MDAYPWWKYLLASAVLVIGGLYALPNIFILDAAVQVTSVVAGKIPSANEELQVSNALKNAGIDLKSSEIIENSLLFRLESRQQQLKAHEIIQQTLGNNYVAAMNLAPSTPAWLEALGGKPMKLGLDLSGGVHFLLEVDHSAALAVQLQGYVAELRKALSENDLRGRIRVVNEQITLAMSSADELNRAENIINRVLPVLQIVPDENDLSLSLQLSKIEQDEIIANATEQNLTTLRNRVNEIGVAEPLVQRQGANRIVVELPGVQDTARAKRILGKTATLEFRMEATPNTPLAQRRRFEFRDSDSYQRNAWLRQQVVIGGDSVVDARTGFDESGLPQVNIVLDAVGGRFMVQTTSNNVGKRLGVLFIERVPHGSGTREKRSIISLATIQEPFGRRFRITGLNSAPEATELALLLRAGALAAPMDFIEERIVGPSLGAENIRLGVNSVIGGLILVFLFMLFYYRRFGVAADIALVLNLMLLVGLLSLLSATLTLPGIAGIVLTVGMAVDANVLVFARIREELHNGLSPHAAIQSGYDRALVTILDANLTTLFAALILYIIGTGPIQGFAITLSLGILTSMFTTLVVTRMIVRILIERRQLQSLNI